MDEHLTIGSKEAAHELNVTQDTISRLCREGKFPGATQDAKGSPWHIPLEAVQARKACQNKHTTNSKGEAQ